MTLSPPLLTSIFFVIIKKVVLISSAFIILGLVYFLNAHKVVDVVKDTKQNISEVASSTDKSVIYLAVNNSPQKPRTENKEDLMKEITFISLDESTNEQKELTSVRSSYFNENFKYVSGKIFFETEYGELATYDIQTNLVKIIKIPGISPSPDKYLNESTISDFLVYDNKIFYIMGICDKTMSCTAAVYDISTAKNEILVPDLHKKIDGTTQTITKLGHFDPTKNILSFTKHGGDADFGFGSVYTIDLTTNKLTEIASTSGQIDCSGGSCAKEDEIDGDVWSLIFPNEDIRCGNVKVKESIYYKNVTLSFIGNDSVIKNAKYVGCGTFYNIEDLSN